MPLPKVTMDVSLSSIIQIGTVLVLITGAYYNFKGELSLVMARIDSQEKQMESMRAESSNEVADVWLAIERILTNDSSQSQRIARLEANLDHIIRQLDQISSKLDNIKDES